MNSYQVTTNVPAKDMSKWLKQNKLPKAAATVTGDETNSSFTIEGNVSALTVSSAIAEQGCQVAVNPIGTSQPLPKAIYIN